MFKNKGTAAKTTLSLGASKTVCGYEIKKMPLGAYLRAAERLQNLPSDFLEACFPGKTLEAVLDELTKADESTITNLITRLITTLPQYLFAVISELSGIPPDTLENDSNIGFDGLVEIINAVIEVNRLGEAVSGLKGLTKKVGLTAAIGSSVSSPAP